MLTAGFLADLVAKNLPGGTRERPQDMNDVPTRPRILSRRKILVAAIALLLAAIAGVILYKHRGYVFPKNFYIVEEGAIYRGARQQPAVLRKIVEKYKIRTIVSLDDKLAEGDHLKGRDPAPYHAARAIAKEANVDFHGYNWKGAGIGPFDEFDIVADILASDEHRPVFVHCHYGRMRTGAALAAYWIKHRGHTAQQAVDRLTKEYNFKPDEEPEFFSNLQRYEEYQRRLQPAGASDRVKAEAASRQGDSMPQ